MSLCAEFSPHHLVIPAKAGTQRLACDKALGTGFRRDHEIIFLEAFLP